MFFPTPPSHYPQKHTDTQIHSSQPHPGVSFCLSTLHPDSGHMRKHWPSLAAGPVPAHTWTGICWTGDHILLPLYSLWYFNVRKIWVGRWNWEKSPDRLAKTSHFILSPMEIYRPQAASFIHRAQINGSSQTKLLHSSALNGQSCSPHSVKGHKTEESYDSAFEIESSSGRSVIAMLLKNHSQQNFESSICRPTWTSLRTLQRSCDG